MTNAALVLVNLSGFGNTIGELLDFNNLFEIAGHGETTQSCKNSNLYKTFFLNTLEEILTTQVSCILCPSLFQSCWVLHMYL